MSHFIFTNFVIPLCCCRGTGYFFPLLPLFLFFSTKIPFYYYFVIWTFICFLFTYDLFSSSLLLWIWFSSQKGYYPLSFTDRNFLLFFMEHSSCIVLFRYGSPDSVKFTIVLHPVFSVIMSAGSWFLQCILFHPQGYTKFCFFTVLSCNILYNESIKI